MPLSSEKIKYTTLTSSIKSLAKEQDFDLVLGYLDLPESYSGGVLLLLYSHRHNREKGVLVTDCPKDSALKIYTSAQEIIGEVKWGETRA